MVLDSSAIISIHLGELGYEILRDKIKAADVIMVGAPTLFETVMVLTARRGTDCRPVIFAFVRRIEAEVVPFNEEHLDAAITAFIRFGRGHHPAKLNFGDCMSYAIASVAGMPLLFTGNDFSKTDIVQA
jgi:ribonuclease VapC